MFFMQLTLELALIVGSILFFKTGDVLYGSVILGIGVIGLLITIYRYYLRNTDCSGFVPDCGFIYIPDFDCDGPHHGLDCDGLDCDGGPDCDCSP